MGEIIFENQELTVNKYVGPVRVGNGVRTRYQFTLNLNEEIVMAFVTLSYEDMVKLAKALVNEI